MIGEKRTVREDTVKTKFVELCTCCCWCTIEACI